MGWKVQRFSVLQCIYASHLLGFVGANSSAPGAVDDTLASVHHRYHDTQAAFILLISRSEVAH
jgi:hypothetical protein